MPKRLPVHNLDPATGATDDVIKISGGKFTIGVSPAAPLNSPTFTGDPKAPTPTAGDNDTSIATTAFVASAVSSGVSGLAALASPTFTGDPRAPTPGAGDNDTSIATTAFVTSAVAGKADLASPTFTGDPKAPTPTAGDNDTSLATTAFVTNALAKQAEVLMFALGDETTAITTGTAKVTIRMPFAMTVTAVRASLSTASSSGIPAFNVKDGGSSIFSTTLTIDATEKTSTTAATPAVISGGSHAFADDAEVTFDIDTAGTGAKGPKITFIGTRT